MSGRLKISRKQIQAEFVRKVEELSGQNLGACYQCGKCSAGCPIAYEMDILPNQVIRLIQLGDEAEVLSKKAFWLCSSCLECMSRCPKGVDLAKIMEALRELLKRRGIDLAEFKKISAEMWEKLPQQVLVSVLRKYSL